MRGKKVREDDYFAGAESGYDRQSFPATEFYKGVPQVPQLKKVYRFLEDERFDIYNILTALPGFRRLKRKDKDALS